ncbi:MAG TPA: response regulator [Symbiobacteriaceae bacterium]|nr:response regulator [Symbiobacteriaceae bacterium]
MVRLFLADDMPAVREVLRFGLANGMGHVVVGEAANGEDALAAIPALAPDVAILDVDMPGLNGVEVARRLRLQGDTTPIILCSSGESGQQGDLPPGVVDRLQKPFALERLAAAVDQAVAVRAL